MIGTVWLYLLSFCFNAAFSQYDRGIGVSGSLGGEFGYHQAGVGAGIGIGVGDNSHTGGYLGSAIQGPLGGLGGFLGGGVHTTDNGLGAYFGGNVGGNLGPFGANIGVSIGNQPEYSPPQPSLPSCGPYGCYRPPYSQAQSSCGPYGCYRPPHSQAQSSCGPYGCYRPPYPPSCGSNGCYHSQRMPSPHPICSSLGCSPPYAPGTTCEGGYCRGTTYPVAGMPSIEYPMQSPIDSSFDPILNGLLPDFNEASKFENTQQQSFIVPESNNFFSCIQTDSKSPFGNGKLICYLANPQPFDSYPFVCEKTFNPSDPYGAYLHCIKMTQGVPGTNAFCVVFPNKLVACDDVPHGALIPGVDNTAYTAPIWPEITYPGPIIPGVAPIPYGGSYRGLLGKIFGNLFGSPEQPRLGQEVKGSGMIISGTNSGTVTNQHGNQMSPVAQQMAQMVGGNQPPGQPQAQPGQLVAPLRGPTPQQMQPQQMQPQQIQPQQMQPQQMQPQQIQPQQMQPPGMPVPGPPSGYGTQPVPIQGPVPQYYRSPLGLYQRVFMNPLEAPLYYRAAMAGPSGAVATSGSGAAAVINGQAIAGQAVAGRPQGTAISSGPGGTAVVSGGNTYGAANGALASVGGNGALASVGGNGASNTGGIGGDMNTLNIHSLLSMMPTILNSMGQLIGAQASDGGLAQFILDGGGIHFDFQKSMQMGTPVFYLTK